MSDSITREIVDQTVKDDPSLSLRYALGEDPIEIMKNKLKQQDQQEQAEEVMDSADSGPASSDIGPMPDFDSSAPIDLGTSEQTGEEPSVEETGPSTGEETVEPSEPPAE